MYNILITDNLSPQALAILNAADDVNVDIVKGLSDAQLAEKIKDYHALIIRSSVRVTKAVLDKAENLVVVGRAGVGVDNVDLEEASLRGVIVMNTPGANSMATAEFTMSLMLALARNVPQAHQSLAIKSWDRKKFLGTQLYKKTLGIVGLGRIGSRVALRSQGFGMNVIAYDPYLGEDAARALKVTLVSLDELFAQADFITLHAAHTPETEKMVNAQSIARMKEGVRIINCARGALIDEAALAEALQQGKVAGAALDVFSQEPLPEDNPLRDAPNVVHTPHLAASTVEAQRDVSHQVVTQVLDTLRGAEIRNAVNMPLNDPKLLAKLRPFLYLAEQVGSLQAQLAEGRIDRIEVEFHGDEIAGQAGILTVALLKGILSPTLSQYVNYVNAPHLAKQRGITVAQSTGLGRRNYNTLISCRVYWHGGQRMISATSFQQDEPRIVQLDGYRIDVRPEGRILVIKSIDVPGVIGKTGTLLGDAGINIASMRWGRDKPGGIALSFIKVDHEVSNETINHLLDVDFIQQIYQVVL